MSYAIVIPAQNSNQYNERGDLASFGDTNLLRWKISQCKEAFNADKIFISSSCEEIKKIAEQENVAFLRRDVDNGSFTEAMLDAIIKLSAEDILWVNVISPFMSAKDYVRMYSYYCEHNSNCLVSVEKRSEYAFCKKKKVNFGDDFVSRTDIEPVYIVTNGCIITKRELALKNKNLVDGEPDLFEVDSFSAIEIKDVKDYAIARELLSLYFLRDIYV